MCRAQSHGVCSQSVHTQINTLGEMNGEDVGIHRSPINTCVCKHNNVFYIGRKSILLCDAIIMIATRILIAVV